jgi:hypothetical protein
MRASKRQKRTARGKQGGRENRARGEIVAPRVGDVDRVLRTALSLGWEGRFAFNTTLLMLANGATVAEAQALFRDASRRVQ